MKVRPLRLWTTLSSLAVLTACGGGGGESPGSSLLITGTAATGAAIVSGTVEAKCQSGTGSATTSASGAYAVNVSSGVQPCILRVTDPVTQMQLHSMIEAGATTANISPATDLVVANALAETPTTAFSNYSSIQQQKITAANISSAVTRVQMATAALGSAADMTGMDIMKGTLHAATNDAIGNTADQKIDALMAALAAADKKIADLSAELTAVTSGSAAASKLTTLVGSAKDALASCPSARSSDIWVLDFLGSAPMGYNADFSAMVLKNMTDNSTSVINLKRDAQNAVVPCAFTSNVNGSNVEYRVTDGGIGVWKTDNNFGISVPAQRSKLLTDAAFTGTYPSAGFLREHTQGFRTALPFKFQVNTDGMVKGYSCDLTKTTPDCTNGLNSSNSISATCTPMSNGTLSCSASNGMQATAVLYMTGGQVSMFVAVTQMPVSGYNYGGLLVMTKASPMTLPTAGQTKAAGSAWYAGVNPGSTTVVAGDTAASFVETISSATNSYVTSSTGSTTTYTRYINTPSEGFGLSRGSNGYTSISLGSATGWSVTMAKSSTSTAYDGWSVYARAKR